MKDLNKLQLQAEEAAANFVLPPDWREDRIPIRGLAIDDHGAYRAEDSIWFDYDKQILNVSAVDTGSFLFEGPIGQYARQVYADRAVKTSGKHRLDPMVSFAVPRRGLNFANQKDCPAITVQIPSHGSNGDISVIKSIVNAQRLTMRSGGRMFRSGRGDIPNVLRGADAVAGHFVSEFVGNNKNKPSEESSLSNAAIGRLLVKKCIQVACSAVADFMNQNGIPAIYINNLWSDPYKTFFSSESFGHGGVGVHNYAQFTSPMRRFQDFVNQANISAYLDGRNYPYPEHKLDIIAPDLNSHYGYEAVSFFSTRSAEYLKVALSNNGVRPHYMGDAIFAPIGTTDEVDEVKALALQAIEQDPSAAKSVIDYAISKGYLIQKELRLDGRIETEPVLEDRDGNVFPAPNGESWRKFYASADILGKICGIAVRRNIPVDHQEKIDKILGINSYRFIHNMSRGKNPQLRMNTMQEEDGTIVMDVYLRGEMHRRRFKGDDRSKSILGAAKQHIIDHDLIYNPPHPLEQSIVDYSPSTALREWQVHTGAAPVEFITSQEGDGVIVCKASLRTAEGIVHEATGIGFDTKAVQAAKRSATVFLLQKLPHGPYPRAVPVLSEAID